MFVSSHLMSEMEHTADQLVVIGRGELIAAESLARFSARGPVGSPGSHEPMARKFGSASAYALDIVGPVASLTAVWGVFSSSRPMPVNAAR